MCMGLLIRAEVLRVMSTKRLTVPAVMRATKVLVYTLTPGATPSPDGVL